MKEPKIISIMHRKGGVGKSSMIISLATYLNHKGHNSIILDLDPKNETCTMLRNRNIEDAEKLSLKSKASREYHRLKAQNKIYPIQTIAPKDLSLTLSKIREGNDKFKIEYVFIDSPGAVEDQGFIETIKQVQHVLIPMINDQKNDENTIEYYLKLDEMKPKLSNIKTIDIFFNNIEYSLKDAMETLMKNKIKKENLFTNFIKHNKHFKAGQLQTILPIEEDFMRDFVKEFKSKTNK